MFLLFLLRLIATVLTAPVTVSALLAPHSNYRHLGYHRGGWSGPRRTQRISSHVILSARSSTARDATATTGRNSSNNGNVDKSNEDAKTTATTAVPESHPAKTTPQFLAGLWRLIAEGNHMVRGVS